jgi:hypothetical protein
LKGGPQSFSIFEKDSEHTAYDFVNLRDAFQKHWIYGFPLWPIEEKYDTASGKSALLPYWLGMVRQTAALYRIDTEYWAAITNTFAKRFARAQDPAHPHGPKNVGNKAQLAEKALSMLGTAVELRLGHKAAWYDRDNFHDNEKYLIIGHGATPQEVELVSIAGLYGTLMDTRIRKLLGEEYSAWEDSWLDATVPDELPGGVICAIGLYVYQIVSSSAFFVVVRNCT